MDLEYKINNMLNDMDNMSGSDYCDDPENAAELQEFFGDVYALFEDVLAEITAI